jgi:hypothetical protein
MEVVFSSETMMDFYQTVHLDIIFTVVGAMIWNL